MGTITAIEPPAAVPQGRQGATVGAAAGLRAAWLLSAAVVVLQAAAAAAGLWAHRLYQDAAFAVAAMRGGDLVTLLVAVPALTVALVLAARGSLRARLVWVGMLAYSVYNTAYYVFGAAFNDGFLVHVALFSASLFALGLLLANLDVAAIATRFGPRTPARPAGALLLAVAAVLGGLWSFFSLRFAVTGTLPGDVLPPSAMHLVYVLDLSLLVPSFAVAGILAWRRAPSGCPLAAAMSVYGAVYQLNLLSATAFQVDAHVAGAAFGPLPIVLGAAFLAAAALLLANLRDGAGRR